MAPGSVDERDVETEIAILTAIVLDLLGPALARYRVQAGRRLDLDAPSLLCLEMLRRPGTVTGAVISESTGLTSSAVSKMLGRLEAAGHVERDARARRGEVVEVASLPHRERDDELGRLRAELARGLRYTLGHRVGGPGWDTALGLLRDVADRLHVEACRHVDHQAEARRARRRERDRRDRC